MNSEERLPANYPTLELRLNTGRETACERSAIKQTNYMLLLGHLQNPQALAY